MSSSSLLKSTPSPFLKVPLELRRQICAHLLPIHNGVITYPREYDKMAFISGYQGLMKTNRQINREMSSMLYWDSMIPISVYCRGITLLGIWATLCDTDYQPLWTFDFRMVRKLEIRISSFEETVKCIAGLRANVLKLCAVLKDAPCTMEYLRIHLESYSRNFGVEWPKPYCISYFRPASSLVKGFWDFEIIMQPFRTLHGIGNVDIELNQQVLTLPEIKAWKEALQQVMTNPTPCDQTVLVDVRLLTAKTNRSLERWKLRERHNLHYDGPRYAFGMSYSEEEVYKIDRGDLFRCIYSSDLEISLKDTDCKRKVRSFEALYSSDECAFGNLFGEGAEKEKEEGEGQKAEYRDGARIGNFCS